MLDDLFNLGNISKDAYAEISRRLRRVQNKIEDLRKMLETEQGNLLTEAEKCVNILERILIELNVDYAFGGLDGEALEEKSKILMNGIYSLRNAWLNMPLREPVSPTFSVNEKDMDKTKEYKNKNRMRKHPRRYQRKCERKVKKKLLSQTRTDINDTRSLTASVRCMNPWNKNCKNTDIEVNIYYKGELLP
ncbi:TPA: hypothetical protein EYP70_00050, partial [Candidatus Bathyarchaeota archaeon]|nr:hypothetical protein [Candidatus Bathyarchaeota archaeon]